MASANFIDDLQNIVTEYMKSAGFSVGISDLISNQSTNDEIVKVITNKKTEVKNLINQVQLGIFENNTGKTNEEEFETQVNSILNQATSEADNFSSHLCIYEKVDAVLSEDTDVLAYRTPIFLKKIKNSKKYIKN
jgi:DNA-directed RNA polymerase beta' subunit